MYIFAEVDNDRNITTSVYDTPEQAVIALYETLEREHKGEPFGPDFVQTLNNLDFTKSITLEVNTDNAGFVIYNLSENYTHIVAWTKTEDNMWDGDIKRL